MMCRTKLTFSVRLFVFEQENRAPVYTALRKSTSADGQMKNMEVEFKTYHKMSTLSQDSGMRPNYDFIGFV